MSIPTINKLRLAAHGLLEPTFQSPLDCVSHMVAMQAQDPAMVKWAVGMRVKNGTELQVNKALDKGEILRTHLLRPTWHLVAARDILWLLDLTAPRILSGMKSRHKELGLTTKLLTKSITIIQRALIEHKVLTREEILAEFAKAKIDTGENRASHLLVFAELQGLICSGKSKNGKTTFTLLENRVKRTQSLNRQEALVKLAKGYFKSHGPATLQDFNWWSGLSATEARYALENIKNGLTEINFNGQTYYSDPTIRVTATNSEQVRLLPAFDELVISYKERTMMLEAEHHKKAISVNGIFYPTIIKDGRAIGTWKRTTAKDKVLVEMHPFGKSSPAKLKKAATGYGYFLNKEINTLIK